MSRRNFILSAKWQTASLAVRDAISIFSAAVLAWLLIERTETCDRFFDWVAENPDYEVDSAILAFILSAIGITIFAIRRYREAKEAMVNRIAAEERALVLAVHDPLTGLPNRRALTERLRFLLQPPKASKVGLLLVDLDRFKAVNDVHGHLAGDRLLQLVAERMQGALKPGEAVFRLGGDEFALVCEADRDPDASRRLARRLISLLGEPFADSGLVHHIGASIGIATFPSDARNQEQLMRRADVALYRAKEAGRGLHRSFEPRMDAEIARRASIEQELRAAIHLDELRPFYQPVVDLSSGKPIGFEMLARWPRRNGVELGPDEFIPIAEESGLINDLMLQLLRRSCHDAAKWPASLTVAVNVSPVQLKDPKLSQKILKVLTEAGFPPQRLTIEITENALIADAENARRTIESLKNQGMTIGLDDFGTGYSSLQHLRLLPFNKIKIDRSFVQAINSDPESLKIVRAIVSLASSLSLPVIAEGVETAAAAQTLQELGCSEGQGFHFGRPLTAEAITKALNRGFGSRSKAGVQNSAAA